MHFVDHTETRKHTTVMHFVDHTEHANTLLTVMHLVNHTEHTNIQL